MDDSNCLQNRTQSLRRDLAKIPPCWQPDDEPVVDCEVIDSEGDVLLRSGVKEFQVSSKVLSLASSYFDTMFRSEFAEGCALRNSTVPLPINVSDDNPEALAVLLHIIHFSGGRRYLKLDVDMQFDVAVLSDKYDCTRALYSDSQRWLMSINAEKQSISSLWKLAAVAFLMYHPMLFAQQTSQLAQVLAADDLNGPLPLSSLPDTLREALQSARVTLLDRMIAEVENTMNYLRRDSQRFDMLQKECTHCGNLKSLPTKKCHNCSNTEFYTLYCDAGSRLCDFIGSLESAGAWPLSRRRKNSAVKFQSKMKSALPQAHHSCLKRGDCPLVKRSESLERRLESTLKQSSNVDFKSHRFESLV